MWGNHWPGDQKCGGNHRPGGQAKFNLVCVHVIGWRCVEEGMCGGGCV